MENAEKVQDAQVENTVENPENVQQEAELDVNQEEGQSDPPDIHDEESEVSENSTNEIDETTTEELEKPDSTSTEEVEEVKVAGTVSQETKEVAEETAIEVDAALEPEGQAQASEVSENLTNQIDEVTTEEVEKPDSISNEEVEEVVNENMDKVDDTDEIVLAPVLADSSHAEETTSEESDKKNESSEEEEENLDFTKSTKEELVQKIREISKEEKISRIDKYIKSLKPRFDELFGAERAEAADKFEKEGNDPDAFEYHGNELDKEFSAIHSELRSKRNRYYKELGNQKDDNLKKKQSLLEKLREVVDGVESTSSINSVRDIQGEWKKIGPVPGSHNKTLWANFNALLDRFYDQRSIYFELKDLDRKKNFDLKVEICERAEALDAHPDLKLAIVQLNELHEEYKHVGPVPRGDQETLWQRFKAASDAVYAKRKDFFDNLKVEFEANFEKKLVLAKEAEEFVNFDAEGISEWNTKTKEIQALQKKWEEIGGLPRDKAKAINKQFWGSFKKFFNNKNQFFKRLESTRDENLQKKEELIRQAEEIKESTDWKGTTNKYKDLQAQWKDIGPVPEKVRNEIYKRFKATCDHFFNRRRDENSEQEKQYADNFKLKLQICEQIEAIADKDEINLDDIYDLVDNHAQLGFVPRNDIKKDKARFEEATHKILSLEDLEDRDKTDLENHIRKSRMRGGGNRGVAEPKINRKEHSIKRKISELEGDINLWTTNMEFFASSATADKLKADLQTKIESAEGELVQLKEQLKTIS